MPSPTRTPAAPWIPRRVRLPEEEWRGRHRLVCGILAAHVVLLPIYALAVSERSWQGWSSIAAVAGLTALALAPLPRRARTIGAALALLTATGALIVLANGASYATFHVLLAVTLIALYEDWPAYLVSVGYIVAQHVAALALTPPSLREPGVPAWEPALVHGVLVLLTCAAQVVFWHYLEKGRVAERAARERLTTGEQVLRDQMNELAVTREQLIATVSHEFRTPLTAIRGSALTLRRRRSRIDAQRTDEMLDAIIANTDRLSRLLENMLAAAEVEEADGWDVADVYEVANEVAMVVHGRHTSRRARGERPQPVTVAVPRRLQARIDREALHQVLANLVDNAVIHAAPGSQALLTGVAEGGNVVITVANEAQGIDAATLAALFEPFTLADASDTRSPHGGAGVGLYVVRRLVDAAHGTVSVHSEPGWVSVEVRLPAAVDVPRGATLIDVTDAASAPPATA